MERECVAHFQIRGTGCVCGLVRESGALRVVRAHSVESLCADDAVIESSGPVSWAVSSYFVDKYLALSDEKEGISILVPGILGPLP